MKAKKNNLDERQEQILLKIEHKGFWLAFWLLLAAMLVQSITSGVDFRVYAGECAILLIISLYVSIECIRNGIWDRKIQPKASANILASLIAGLAMGVVNAISLMRFFDKPWGAIAAGAVIGVITFLLCMIALSVSMRLYRKRAEKMEEEPEDIEEDITEKEK